MKTFFWWWLCLFGVWPLADPGHTDFNNPVVWIDVALHLLGMVVLINREIERRVERRISAMDAGAE